MIEHAWSILCTRAITDPDSKNVTLVEVIEQVNITREIALPAVAPMTTDFVSCFYRSNPDQPERAVGRIVLVRPNGTENNPAEFGIDLTSYVMAHAIVRSGAIEIISPGRYFFRVDIRPDGDDNWTQVARLPLTVVVHDQLPGV